MIGGNPLLPERWRILPTEADWSATGEALVVFVDESGLRCLRWLRRGFRHCFVAVRRDTAWVICDPLSHRTDLTIIDGFTGEQLAFWYRSHGFQVVLTHVRPCPRRLAPLRPYTCVEAVKRVLGMHAPWVLTPWQLYRRLSPSEAGDPRYPLTADPE